MWNTIIYYENKENADKIVNRIIKNSQENNEDIIKFNEELSTYENIYKIINENNEKIKTSPKLIIIDDYINKMQELLFDDSNKHLFARAVRDLATFISNSERFCIKVVLVVNQNSMHKSLMLSGIENEIKLKTFADTNIPTEYTLFL